MRNRCPRAAVLVGPNAADAEPTSLGHTRRIGALTSASARTKKDRGRSATGPHRRLLDPASASHWNGTSCDEHSNAAPLHCVRSVVLGLKVPGTSEAWAVGYGYDDPPRYPPRAPRAARRALGRHNVARRPDPVAGWNGAPRGLGRSPTDYGRWRLHNRRRSNPDADRTLGRHRVVDRPRPQPLTELQRSAQRSRGHGGQRLGGRVSHHCGEGRRPPCRSSSTGMPEPGMW